jgi:hypothetical protein
MRKTLRALTWTFARACALAVLVFKWLHDKFILRPRLERVRAQVRSWRERELWLVCAPLAHAVLTHFSALFVARSARRR